MQNKDTSRAAAQASSQRSTRERIGLAVFGTDALAVVSAIIAAEDAGIKQVWMTQGTPAPDSLTIFTAAFMRTTSVRLGTSIVPTYPRHPLALAQQALALGDLAPARLRLGIGPSHRQTIEGVYGIPMKAPLEHLREYVTVLRQALWEGKIDYRGHYYTVRTPFPRTPHTPILISALREGAFHLAGEISDGAISWVCPVPYLLEKALPALRAGAAKSGRAVPPLVAYIPVALHQDRQAVLAAARRQLGRYGQSPFYASMFADAGFPVSPDGTMSDALFDNLVVSGDEAAVKGRLVELLGMGLDELLVMQVPVADAEGEMERLMSLIGQM
jgi:F420-dependent oxidoreductase-like protein